MILVAAERSGGDPLYTLDQKTARLAGVVLLQNRAGWRRTQIGGRRRANGTWDRKLVEVWLRQWPFMWFHR